MALGAGTRLGVYEITAMLGAGGMGEVYRALETKHKRDVAIKLLPAALSGDPEREARLQREALTLAALNHPNLAAIHALEEAAFDHLVASRLTASGPLPCDGAGRRRHACRAH